MVGGWVWARKADRGLCGSRRQGGERERDGISEQLPVEINVFVGVPKQALKVVHNRRIAVSAPNQASRKSLFGGHDVVFREDRDAC